MAAQERVILITGGGGGIGRAIAEAFVQTGARVAILGRNADTLRAVVEHLGPQVSSFVADVRDHAQITAAVAETVSRFGHIDVLVNNAGVVEWVDITIPLAAARERWERVLATNLTGAFLVAAAVAPHLTRPGGRIINISSIAAFTGGTRPGAVAYVASKAGLHGLTYGLARELAADGITVNAIAPGFIADTGMRAMWSQAQVQEVVAATPAGRVGTPQDIAGAVLYLASPGASFITGEILHVNGGRLFGR